MPKVSVIIPTFNNAASIARAVDSVLRQDFADFEVIVVDDGSTDDTKKVLGPYSNRIKYFFQQNSGVCAARNRGIREAKGEYTAFLDADDVWIPDDKLSLQIKILDERKNAGIVYSKMIVVDEDGRGNGLCPAQDAGNSFQEMLTKGAHYPTSTVMTRKACFERCGYFDETLSTIEDFDMWLRIARDFEVIEIKDRLLGYYYRSSLPTRKDPLIVYEAQIKVCRKILGSYQDIPVKQMRDKLAGYLYHAGRLYFDRRNYEQALRYLGQAIALKPLMGSLFIVPADNVKQRALKILKPYAFLALCTAKYVQRWFNKQP